MGWGRLRGFKRLLYLQYCVSASCLWIKTSVLSAYSSAMPANLRVAIFQDMMETDYSPAELSDEKYFREKRFVLSHISEREGGGGEKLVHFGRESKGVHTGQKAWVQSAGQNP